MSVAVLFVLGMRAIDGANGLWISRLIRRADHTAAVASRAMALAFAGISLAVGAFTVARILLPAVNAWAAGRELWFGTVVVTVVLFAFAVAMRMARRRAVPCSECGESAEIARARARVARQSAMRRRATSSRR